MADVESHQNNVGILIPCEQDRFGEFIAGLLTKSASISKVYGGNFLIKFNDILNFHCLLEQRIKEQNENSYCIQMSIKVRFSDGTNIEFRDFRSFESYAEHRPIFPVGLSISWVYVIGFASGLPPEKQQVDIDFIVKNDQKSKYYSVFGEYDIDPDSLFQLSECSGIIHLRINHSRRTWGLDVLNVFDGNIKTIIKESEGIIFQLILRYKTFILGIYSSLAFLLSLSVLMILVAHEHNKNFTNYVNLIKNSKDETQSKLDILLYLTDIKKSKLIYSLLSLCSLFPFLYRPLLQYL